MQSLQQLTMQSAHHASSFTSFNPLQLQWAVLSVSKVAIPKPILSIPLLGSSSGPFPLRSPLRPPALWSIKASLVAANDQNPFIELSQKDGGAEECKRSTLKEICANKVPDQFLQRAEELGFKHPTEVQIQALPKLLAGQDCILHSQTGSGKTLCYLLAIFSKVVLTRAAVQAIVIVPTRELGMQVVRAARRLACKKSEVGRDEPGSTMEKGVLNVMSLLDGGTLNRQKIWLKADPPQVVVGTLQCICKMIETKHLRTKAVTILVIDEVDAIFGPTKQSGQLRMLLTCHSLAQSRQTIFASATIPQHSQFVRKCINEKWTKDDLIHVQANPTHKMPSYLKHCHVVCDKNQKLETLTAVLHADNPKAAIIFVNEQSETAKRKGLSPMTTTVAEFLSSTFDKSSNKDSQLWDPLVLEQDSNIYARASSLSGFQEGRRLLVATDLAARGLDLPEVSHVYNLDIPPTATAYVHRGGRTARKPLTEDPGTVTTFVTAQEIFALQRFQNELLFQSVELQVGDGYC